MAKRLMREIAADIDVFLKKFQTDPKINRYPAGDLNRRGLQPFFNAWCAYFGGPRISVMYIAFQGAQTMTRGEAELYLGWLQAGNVGQHHRALREEKEKADG